MPYLFFALVLLVSCQQKSPDVPKVRKDEIQKQEAHDVEMEIAKVKKSNPTLR